MQKIIDAIGKEADRLAAKTFAKHKNMSLLIAKRLTSFPINVEGISFSLINSGVDIGFDLKSVRLCSLPFGGKDDKRAVLYVWLDSVDLIEREAKVSIYEFDF